MRYPSGRSVALFRSPHAALGTAGAAGTTTRQCAALRCRERPLTHPLSDSTVTSLCRTHSATAPSHTVALPPCRSEQLSLGTQALRKPLVLSCILQRSPAESGTRSCSGMKFVPDAFSVHCPALMPRLVRTLPSAAEVSTIGGAPAAANTCRSAVHWATMSYVR